MSTIDELKKEASLQFKNKNYNEALRIYNQLWNKYQSELDEWDGWRYAFCLNNTKKYNEALDVCRKVYKMNPNFEKIKESYAWSIYFLEINKNNIEDEEKFFKAAYAIIKLSKQTSQLNNSAACVYTLTIFKVLDYLNTKPTKQSELILEWTSKLDPNLLKTSPYILKDKTGKIRELASYKEKWYVLRSKALFEMEKFKECIELSENALNEIDKFHHDNDIWLKRYIALSKAALGDYETAISEYKKILIRKNEWFIQKELSEFYLKQNKIDEALEFATKSALNKGDPTKKLNLYLLLAYIFQIKGKFNEARRHIELVYCIRKENKWKIDSQLIELIKLYDIEINNLEDSKKILGKLKKYWEDIKYCNLPLQKGIIKTIISGGKAGFIISEYNKSYYFSSKDFIGKKEYMVQGQKVVFYLDNGFDKKKNQQTLVAINVKPIDYET